MTIVFGADPISRSDDLVHRSTSQLPGAHCSTTRPSILVAFFAGLSLPASIQTTFINRPCASSPAAKSRNPEAVCQSLILFRSALAPAESVGTDEERVTTVALTL